MKLPGVVPYSRGMLLPPTKRSGKPSLLKSPVTGGEAGLGRSNKTSCRRLKVELSRMRRGAADINVCQSVAVHITCCGFGAFPGKHFGEVPLEVKIFVLVFFVPVEAGGYAMEEEG